jgi:hypothetical protein
MASSLPTSRYQSENDLRALRKAIGWQSLGYDSKMRHGTLSLTQPDDFVYFSPYALAGLVPLFSSFYSHAAGVLRASALTPVATLHHAGGDLHPLLQDVRGGVAVGAPVPVDPRDVPSEQAATSPRRLLLLAPDEGFFEAPHRPQPRLVGALEGGLGAGASRHP